MLVQKSTLDVAFTAVQMQYLQAQLDIAQVWPNVAMEVSSSTKQNIYPFISKFPAFREWFGDSTLENVATRDYTLINRRFRFGFELDVDALNDDQYGVFSSYVQDAARARREFDDDQIFQTLEAGTTTNCWDGQTFFSASHPVNVDSSSAGTWSNSLISGTYDWSADPVGTFAKVRAAMMKFKRDDGKAIGIVPDTLVCGPDMEQYALKAIEATFITDVVKNAGTPVAAAGVSNIYQGRAKVIVTPWVKSSTRIYALCTTRGLKPLIKQMREDRGLVPRISPSDPNVFEQNTFQWAQVVREAFGYTLPQFAAVAGAS